MRQMQQLQLQLLCMLFCRFFFSLKVATAMFGYMTDLDTVDIVRTEEITAEGM